MARSLSAKLSCLKMRAVTRWATHSPVLCTDCGLSWTSSTFLITQNQRTRGLCGLVCCRDDLFSSRLSQDQICAHPVSSYSTGRSRVSLMHPTHQQHQFSSISSDQSQGQLIYQGRISHLFRALKIFSLTTSGIGLCVQPYLLMTYQDLSLAAAVPFFAAINMFVFMNPILIHFVAKKYVTQLYFNPVTKIFTANLLTFFARKEVLTFTADDVQVPDVPSVFAMLTVRGRPLFVNEGDFTSLEVYKHLMKFDQPIDLTCSQPGRKHNG